MRCNRIAMMVPALLAGCSTIPSGPSTLVLPDQRATPVQFRDDDRACRKFAHDELTGEAHPPHSLAEGQMHFDIHYLQCMYGKGHLIPLPGEPEPAVPGSPDSVTGQTEGDTQSVTP